MAFLIGWKASLILSDGRDLFQNPVMLLFNSGGVWNIAAGIGTAIAWLALKWYRTRPTRGLTLALLRFLLVIAVLGIPALAAWPILSGRQPEIRQKLQMIELTGPEGNIWTTRAAEGRPIVLNFWASWCPPCKAEMPMLADIAQDPRFSDTVFFAVNAQSTETDPDAAVRWLADNGISIPLLFDTQGAAAAALSVTALPTTFILNGRGELMFRRTGAVERSWIISGIRKARKSMRNRN